MAAATAAAVMALAIVTQDAVPLRAAPSASAAQHATLLAGELLEVRGTRLDHLQVYDHRIERAGYVRASQVKRIGTTEADARELLAVLRFVRDTPGAEALGIAYVAAYLKAAPAGTLTGKDGAEPFDALGVMAERLARRANVAKAGSTASQQLEVVAPYGVKFTSFEANGAMRLCYDGEAFRRVAALPAATAPERARAALALTRHDCLDPALRASERATVDRWRAALLDRFSPADTAMLDELTENRLRLRRAGVWAALAFGASRRGEPAQAAAQRAIDELAAINKSELGDDEQAEYTDAAVRVGAVRWAALPVPATPSSPTSALQVRLQAGEPGQTCVTLIAAAKPAEALAQRCTYATVWAASAAPAPDGRALALAVQPLEGWRELWVFRVPQDGGKAWTIDVLPPAAHEPGLGVIEFAGWAPGAKDRPGRLLTAREAISADGRVQRRFETLALDTLAVDKSASTPQLLAAFASHADAPWKRATVVLR